MIKFKQKNFFLLSALTAGSMVQTHKQMKQEKEQADTTAAQNEQITKQLNDLARQVKKNPDAASKVGEIMSAKTFSIPRVKTFGLFDVASLPIMLAQGKKQNDLTEEIGQKQEESMKRMGKALERIQENAQKAYEEQRGYSVIQKTYANSAMFKGIENVANRMAGSKTWQKIANNNTYRNARGFAKDISTVAREGNWGQHIADTAAMASIMAGGSYLVDKAIQKDSKKLGAPITNQPAEQQQEENKSSKLKKGLLIGAGTIGTAGSALLLARKGKLNAQTFKNAGKTIGNGFKNQVMKGPATKEELEQVRARMLQNGKTGEEIEKRLARLSKNRINYGALALNGAMVSAPAIGYLSQRSQIKQQAAQSQNPQSQQQEQRAYSYASALRYKKAISAPGKVVDFLSWGAGRSGQKKLGSALNNLGAKGSGSTWTKKAGDFLQSDKGKVLKAAGGLAVGSSVMMAPWNLTDKAARKALNTVDKNAFAYEKSQQQQPVY